MDKNVENILVMGKSGSGKQPRVDFLIRRFDLKQLSTGDIFRHYLSLFDELGYDGELSQFYDDTAEGFIPDEEIKQGLGVTKNPAADQIVLGLKAKFYVNQGLFVPDPITNALFEAAFREMGFRGAVIDGYPRTVDQAKYLMDLVDRENIKLDAILLIENKDELIIKRTMGRRVCKTCGELYHMEFRPPPKPEECTRSDQPCNIVQRSDDNLESLKARLNEFHAKTQPAIDFLKKAGVPFYAAPGNLPTYAPEAVEASVCEVMGLPPTA